MSIDLRHQMYWRDEWYYVAHNLNSSFQAKADKLNAKWRTGRYLVVEAPLATRNGNDDPLPIASLFVAQVVDYAPLQGGVGLFASKPRISALPRMRVKAPDGTVFEPVVFKDDGKYVTAVATEQLKQYMLKNCCFPPAADEDISWYLSRISVSVQDRQEAAALFARWNEQKAETAVLMEEAYHQRMQLLAEHRKTHLAAADAARQKAKKDADNLRAFDDMFR